MYYIEDQDPILVKNEVLLDQEMLRKLYQEIMLKFGQYVHKSYDGSLGPYGVTKHIEDADYQYIKNYSETKKDDGSGLTHYEYDEYVVPELTKYIMRLIEGDGTAIDEIKKGPVSQNIPKDSGQQQQLHRELQELLNSSPSDMDQEKFRQLTEEIKSYYQGDRDEEQIKELQEYYQKVLACVKFKPVLTLYKDKLNEFRRIYNDIKTFYQGTEMNDIERII